MKNYMQNLRINDIEKELIRQRSIEINRKLVTAGKMPYQESELVHKVLIKALKEMEIDNQGDFKFIEKND